MICPILSKTEVAFSESKGHSTIIRRVECLDKDCEWWVKEFRQVMHDVPSGHCAIRDMAISLSLIKQKG